LVYNLDCKGSIFVHFKVWIEGEGGRTVMDTRALGAYGLVVFIDKYGSKQSFMVMTNKRIFSIRQIGHTYSLNTFCKYMDVLRKFLNMSKYSLIRYI
jgi:hypothetical protein